MTPRVKNVLFKLNSWTWTRKAFHFVRSQWYVCTTVCDNSPCTPPCVYTVHGSRTGLGRIRIWHLYRWAHIYLTILRSAIKLKSVKHGVHTISLRRDTLARRNAYKTLSRVKLYLQSYLFYKTFTYTVWKTVLLEHVVLLLYLFYLTATAGVERVVACKYTQYNVIYHLPILYEIPNRSLCR